MSDLADVPVAARKPHSLDGHMARILGAIDSSDFLMRHLVKNEDPMEIIHLEYAYDEGHLGEEKRIYGHMYRGAFKPAINMDPMETEPEIIIRYRGDFWVKFWMRAISLRENKHGVSVESWPVIYYEAGESNQSAEIGTVWLSHYETLSNSPRRSSIDATMAAEKLFPEQYSGST